jgi:O-antigen/teichoic acid export membrane protein
MDPDAPVDVPLSRSRRLRQFLRSYWTDAGKQAAGNLAGLIVCQGLAIVCQLATLIVLTSTLGKIAYGKYVLATMLFPYLYSLGSIAGGAIALRDIRRWPERFDEIASSHLALAAIVSTAVALTLGLIRWALPIDDDERFLFATVAVGCVFPCLGLTAFFDAHNRQSLGAAASVAADVVGAVTLVGLALVERLNLADAASVLLGRWVLAAALQWIVFFRSVRPIRFCANSRTMLALFLASTAPILLALIWNANNYISVVAVRYRFGEAETAAYGAAMQIALLAIAVFDAAVRILSPHILGEHGLRPDFLRKMFAFLFVLATAVCVGTYVGAAVLVGFVLQPEYQASLAPLAWLLAAAFARAFWAANEWYLVRFHRQAVGLALMASAAGGACLFGFFGPSEWGTSVFPIGLCVTFAAAALISTAVVLAIRRTRPGSP